MDQKQLTQKSKAEHPQTKTNPKNKKYQQKQKTKKTAKRKPNNLPWYSSYKKTFVTQN